jgi:hypothetical protein
MHTNAWLRLAALAAGTAAAGLLAGCTTAAQDSATSPAPKARTSQPAQSSVTGLLPASPSLSDRLVLRSSQVTAGAQIPATIIVTNRGKAPVRLADSNGCRPSYAAAIIKAGQPNISFGASCSLDPLVLAPGVTRLQTTLSTRYQGCTPIKAQATPSAPQCLGGKQHPVIPPLPAGRYRVVLVGENLALPAPAAVTVQLTAPAHRA